MGSKGAVSVRVGLGVQLLASAVLSSSARSKGLRVPASTDRGSASERARAIQGKVAGDCGNRADWRIHKRIAGLDASVVLAAHSLEQVYWSAPLLVDVQSHDTGPLLR